MTDNPVERIWHRLVLPRIVKATMFMFALAIGLLFLLLEILISGCANHCRIDQRPPKDATFEQIEKLKREDCK